MEKHRKGIRAGNLVLSCVSASLIMTLAGSLLSAWLLHKEYMKMESLGYMVMGIIVLAGITAGIISKRKATQKVLIIAGGSGVALFVILLIAGTLIFDGKLQGVGETLLLIVGSILAVVLVGSNRKSKHGSRKHPVRSG